MKLNNLPKQVKKKKKRVGRGFGSGKGGHTVGRGQKGQKARGKISPLFQGTKMKKSLLKRLPLGRGKAKFKPGKKALVVNLKYLELLAKTEEVTLETLIKNKIVDEGQARKLGVKILGEGEVSRAYTVRLPVSRKTREKIEKAGGKVIEEKKRK